MRERIDPRLTASLFANYRSSTDALLELLDNAIDSRIGGRCLEVELTLRTGSIGLTVTGGRGMGPREIEQHYLRWGASPRRAGESIGRYGQGGKAAIGHLGNRFEILASRAGDERAHLFSDPRYRDRTHLRTYELHDRAKPVAADLGYVHLSVGEVDRKLDPLRVRLRLAEVYRPLLLSGEVAIRVNHAPVEPVAWPLVEEHPVSVRAAGRLVGEIELPHVPVTTNKSDVDHDSPEWVAVEARLHRLLAPVVRRLAREQGPAATPTALRTADQVRRILARALRLLESGQLFESPNAAGREGPEGQLTLEEVRAQREEDTGEDAEEAEPPRPEEASGEPTADQELAGGAAPPQGSGPRGGGGSRRGFGDVVIRALDPRVRSAMVEEDGVRRVVINSQYPLYDVRKGDLWYQLETALREVCVTIPEATVPEFERKVNELMLVSLSLAERRRGGRRRAARSARGPWAR